MQLAGTGAHHHINLAPAEAGVVELCLCNVLATVSDEELHAAASREVHDAGERGSALSVELTHELARAADLEVR